MEPPHGRTGRDAGVVAAFDSGSRRQGLLGRVRLSPGRGADPGALLERPHRLHAVSARPGVPRPRPAGCSRRRRGVRPWRIRAAWRAFAVVELAAGDLERSGTTRGGCRRAANYSLTQSRLSWADPLRAPARRSGWPEQAPARIYCRKPAFRPRPWCIVSLLALRLPWRQRRVRRRIARTRERSLAVTAPREFFTRLQIRDGAPP